MGILLIASLSVVNAQRGPRFNDENKAKGQQECKIPDLTEEQEAQIDKLRTAHFKEMEAYRADLGILKAEMQKLKIADKPDQNAIDGKIKDMGAIKTKMAIAANHHHLAVRNLLTDDQKVFFDQHRRGPKMGKGDGHGRRGKGYHGGNNKGCAGGGGCRR